ncbi:MAG: APC family permease [Acetobacteraceae bacterium]|nr:APC family permease [Acetobacteraceae bacterium]
MGLSLSKLLIGRPVANREAESHKLGVFEGVPAMGLDGLGSASYGPEAALTVLAGTGTAGLAAIGPITWVILALLAILWFSYWQTIATYPNNGGSYFVAKENLGINAGLLAAAALMIDYMLNVAVGISAGIGALTSAIPDLHAYTLSLCLGVLAVLTVANLRGTRESGLAWALPTYTFILGLGGTIAWGVAEFILTGHPQPVIPPPPPAHAAEAVTLWLLLRAFASGCTAMTGVEAVSNGVSAFRDPPVRHAHGTLSAIVIVLALLLLGIASLARAYGITAMDQTQDGYQSVLSQLVGAVYGRGWFYYVTIGSVLAVLCLSANTSFVGFPRLCRLVACDGFLPRGFAIPGRRLVYSVGVLFLTAGSGGLLLAFGGITDRLIPLFAVGAFLSFTMSQAGMAAHWWQANGRSTDDTPARHAPAYANRAKLAINGSGAIATGVALAIILVAKFTEGAWLTIIIIPCTLLLLKAIRRYYDEIDRQLLTGSQRMLDLSPQEPPVALVPIKRWDRLSRNAVAYARGLTPDITALHVTSLEGPDAGEEGSGLKQEWREYVEEPAQRAGVTPPRLVSIPSPFRSVVAPLLKGIAYIETHLPGRRVIVVLPELVEGSWWGYLMHGHRERRLRAKLLRYGGADVAVMSVPWQLRPATPREGIAEEEPTTGPPVADAGSGTGR